jgi:uncharacterized membrane protein
MSKHPNGAVFRRGPSSPNFFPLAGPFLVAFFLCIALVIGLLQLGVIEYAYEKVGVGTFDGIFLTGILAVLLA